MPPRRHELDKAEIAVLDTVHKLRLASKGGQETKVFDHPHYALVRSQWEGIAEQIYKGGDALERARQKLAEGVMAVIENVDKGQI